MSGAVITLNGGTRAPVQTQPGQIAQAPAPPAAAVLTDSDGACFRFLTRGNYTLQPARRGIRGAHARMRPSGPSRPPDDGEKVTDVTVRLFKCTSISGTVTDDKLSRLLRRSSRTGDRSSRAVASFR